MPMEEREWTDLEVETLVRLLGSGWNDLRIIAVGLGRTPAEVQRQCDRLQLRLH